MNIFVRCLDFCRDWGGRGGSVLNWTIRVFFKVSVQKGKIIWYAKISNNFKYKQQVN